MDSKTFRKVQKLTYSNLENNLFPDPNNSEIVYGEVEESESLAKKIYGSSHPELYYYSGQASIYYGIPIEKVTEAQRAFIKIHLRNKK